MIPLDIRKITIAIDGFSASGKSTLAKDLAQALGYAYLDSGAMYRAVALYCLNHNIQIKEGPELQQALNQIHITVPLSHADFALLLNGIDVSDTIRSMEVSSVVSEVAAISSVRKHLVKLQQEAGKDGGIVMDGRDIGTVVFPNAELKLYIESSLVTRIERRLQELNSKGKDVARQDIADNLTHRDHIDSTRADSPLCLAADAIVLANDELNRDQQLQMALEIVDKVLAKLPK